MASESRGACDLPHNFGFDAYAVSSMDCMVSRAETIVKTEALAMAFWSLFPRGMALPSSISEEGSFDALSSARQVN